MRWSLALLLVLAGCGAPDSSQPAQPAATGAGSAPPPASTAAQDGSKAYAVCAVCHLANGEGVSGAFPPLRDRAATMAALDGGREYLITVASFGLMGPIDAGGRSYAGVMPGHKGSLDAGQIAAALNHLVLELRDDAGPVEPFTAAEVEAVESATTAASPNTAGVMRGELVARHGDKWPR